MRDRPTGRHLLSRPRRAGALLLILAATPLVTALAADGVDTDPAPRSGGRLIWDLADDLDLLGDLWAELPFRVGRSGEVFLRVDSRATISRASSDFEFEVRDLQYNLELGMRSRFSFSPRHRYSLLVGQRGLERADAPGQPYLRYVAWELEQGDVRTPRDPRGAAGQRGQLVDWKLASGPVLEEREISADFVLRGQARFWLLRSTRLPALSFDVAFDALLDGDHLQSDVSGGPSLSLFLDGGPIASFSLHYQRSRNPLGIGHSAWLLGFEYATRGNGRRRDPPQIEGGLAAGGGDDGRMGGQLRLRFVSPGFARRWQVAVLVEANVLTAEETGDLFYRYDVGIERRSRRHRTGLYFHHRSNHVLAEPNEQVTSINVLEAGVEHEDWLHSGRRIPTHVWGRIDGRARAGYVLDSDFDEDRRWQARGGLRYTPPVSEERLQPYLRVEAAAGNVRSEMYAIGLAATVALDLELEYRNDDQSFSSDSTVLMLSARYGF